MAGFDTAQYCFQNVVCYYVWFFRLGAIFDLFIFFVVVGVVDCGNFLAVDVPEGFDLVGSSAGNDVAYRPKALLLDVDAACFCAQQWQPHHWSGIQESLNLRLCSPIIVTGDQIAVCPASGLHYPGRIHILIKEFVQ